MFAAEICEHMAADLVRPSSAFTIALIFVSSALSASTMSFMFTDVVRMTDCVGTFIGPTSETLRRVGRVSACNSACVGEPRGGSGGRAAHGARATAESIGEFGRSKVCHSHTRP